MKDSRHGVSTKNVMNDVNTRFKRKLSWTCSCGGVLIRSFFPNFDVYKRETIRDSLVVCQKCGSFLGS